MKKETRTTIVFTSIAAAGIGCVGVGGWLLHLGSPDWFYWLLAGVVLFSLIYEED